MFKQTVQQLIKRPRSIFVFVVSFTITILLYYLAIEATSNFQYFIEVNTPATLIMDLILSIGNAALVGISFALFAEIIAKRRRDSSLNIVQTLTSLFFSVVTTGCYACGAILLPTLGITASFGAMPFGGLEIKFLTLLLLLYSTREFAKTYLEICEIKNYKTYALKLQDKSVNLNFKLLDRYKPLLITFLFVVLIYSLPSLLSNVDSAYGDAAYACHLADTGN